MKEGKQQGPRVYLKFTDFEEEPSSGIERSVKQAGGFTVGTDKVPKVLNGYGVANPFKHQKAIVTE